MHGRVHIRLIERLAVDIDDAVVKVNVHGLSLGRNDALDDGLIHERLLAQHNDVPLLGMIKQVGDDDLVILLKRRHHGVSDNVDHARAKHKQQHAEHQCKDDALDPVIHFGAGIGAAGIFAVHFSIPRCQKFVNYIIHAQTRFRQLKLCEFFSGRIVKTP